MEFFDRLVAPCPFRHEARIGSAVARLAGTLDAVAEVSAPFAVTTVLRGEDAATVRQAARALGRRIPAGVIPTGRVVALVVATLAGAGLLRRHHADALAEAAGTDRRTRAIDLAAVRAVPRIATALTLAHLARDHHAVTDRETARADVITAAMLLAVGPVALIVTAFA